MTRRAERSLPPRRGTVGARRGHRAVAGRPRRRLAGPQRRSSAMRHVRPCPAPGRLPPRSAARLGSLALVVGGAALGSTEHRRCPGRHRRRTPGTAAGERVDHERHGQGLRQRTEHVALPAATAPPAPAPPSLEGAPALRPHEMFGFAPYWTLPSSSGFNLAGLTTLAYFSVDVGGDATVQQSGPGWVGYQSQALADLVTRAHGAGDRVVLTASCFDQSALDKMAADPTAGARLGASLVQLVAAKNLDGVNIDFEGKGSKDQAGLDTLVAAVSSAMHAGQPALAGDDGHLRLVGGRPRRASTTSPGSRPASTGSS